MAKERTKKPAISIVGAGSLALALAPALQAGGYRIDEIIVRGRRPLAMARKVGARAETFDTASYTAQVFWLCVSDGAIREVACQLASLAVPWQGRYVLHSSGALSSDELDAVRKRGARVASLHPMMTFVRSSAPSLSGVGFAVEGDAPAVTLARRIVRELGGHIFGIRKSAKPLYHAWGAFGSPLLIMELAVAEQVARAAGMSPKEARRTIEPIVRRTIDNYFAHGAAASFSGPLVRGDVGTVRRHLEQLSKVAGAREVYLALARSAVRNLPVARRAELQRLLRRG
jgi:predicted short-subunit dehydrogenase-like oxidoreductase (DUF2520 family)